MWTELITHVIEMYSSLNNEHKRYYSFYRINARDSKFKARLTRQPREKDRVEEQSTQSQQLLSGCDDKLRWSQFNQKINYQANT
jgi:hypothetical protein